MNPLHTGESLSLWLDKALVPEFSPLRQNLKTDVCIVGGGIGGLTTAYLLLKEGKDVTVLESHEIGSGQTGRTSAHLSNALDDRYYNLEKWHGEGGARLAQESHTAAMNQIELITREENIVCDLERVSGYLFSEARDGDDILLKELGAMQRAGLFGAQILSNSPFRSFDTRSCLQVPDQLQLHPMKYLAGLTERIVSLGGRIYTHTHVTEVKGGSEAYVKIKDGHQIDCKSIVIATNTPINDTFAIHTKQAPYRSYVVGFKIEKDSFPKGLFWDTSDPYHYIRVDSHHSKLHDILIVGGEDHKTGQQEDNLTCYSNLEAWTRSRFPQVNEALYRWSGQVMEPVDGLGYLGHNPMDKNNVYVITGDSGNGLTHATIGAMIITDQIFARKNKWEDLYSPSRISLLAAGEFLKENANVAMQYSDWLVAQQKPNLQTIPKGEGVVFRDGLTLMAVYKDNDGNLEYLSPTCPHLGAVVSWNKAEKSWDCPCHGSRFDCHGKVMEGPAFQDLKRLEVENDTLTPIDEALREERLRMNERFFTSPLADL